MRSLRFSSFSSLLFFALSSLLLLLSLQGCPNPPPPQEITRPDGSQTDDPTTLPEDPPERCIGNNDGIIEKTEVAFVLGASVNVLRNDPQSVVDINQVGTRESNGVLVWDFRNLSLNTRDTIRTTDPTGKWFLSDFPTASMLIPTRYPGFSGSIFQVLRETNSDLLLEGIASDLQEPEAQRILLRYETPIPLLRFPLRDGKEWVITAKAQGEIGGLPLASTDTYQFRIAGRGTLKIPDIEFQNALRVEIFISQRLLGGNSRTLFQILYMNECYGEIARIESLENEKEANFSKASLVRFLTF